LRGSELAYDDLGNGPAIVLLHGFPFDRSMWREQIDFLDGTGYRVIAPDLRGLGTNKASEDFTTMDQMARDVVALMDERKIDRGVVCGLSMGAYVGFELVSLFPSRVHALVLAGARAQGPDDAEKKSREEKARLVLAEGMTGLADEMLPQLLAAKTLAEKPDVVARVREMIGNTNPRGAAAAQRGMAARRDYSDGLHEINAPTLIIAGRDDAIRTPKDAELIHNGIRNSRLETVDDAGHLTNIEQPDVFNRALLGFLTSNLILKT